MNDAINATTGAELHAALCERYATLLLEYGRWFLLAALIIGTIGAAVLVLKSFQATDAGDDDAGGGGAPALQAIIEALKGLVEAFAKAPTWLAMFGGGALLMWMAGSAISSRCVVEADMTENGSIAAPERSGAETGNGAGNSTNVAAEDGEEGGGGS